MNIVLVNCQSVCNKYDDIANYVEDLDLDALVITETWLTGKDSNLQISHNMSGNLPITLITF